MQPRKEQLLSSAAILTQLNSSTFLMMVPEILQKRRVILWKASCDFKNLYFQMSLLIAFTQDWCS